MLVAVVPIAGTAVFFYCLGRPRDKGRIERKEVNSACGSVIPAQAGIYLLIQAVDNKKTEMF